MDNTLVLRRTEIGGKLYPTKESVGHSIHFNFGSLGYVYAKIIQVSDSYATYEFPSDFNIKSIKERIYEESKKTVSIQSVQSGKDRNNL